MKLTPYQVYRHSRLPWVGAMPDHWQTERAKWLFTKMQRPVQDSDEVVTCFRDGTVTLRKNRRLRGYTEAIFEFGYQGIKRGDLVIHAMDAFAGAVGVSDSDGKGTPVYSVCQPKPGVNPKYYAHLVREMARTQWILALSRGIRERSTDFRFETFGAQFVPLPPPDEQAAIVRFLDWANGRLERAIRAKRKIIALLNEQKQAIIHRAVTRGLDPNAPLKPSGIPWLGEIPAHWEALPVKRCSSVISKGTTPSTEGREILESGSIRFLKAENISGGVIVNKPLVFIDEETHAVLRRSQLQQGDVLFVIAGATLGKTAIIELRHLPANTNQAVAFIRPNRRVDSRFLALWLQSPRIKEQIWLNAVQSAQPNLSMASLGMFAVPLPPPAEQITIVEAIERETSGCISAIFRLESEITLLREYRTRLVADVVTGKLDVREAAAGLPEGVGDGDEVAVPDEIVDDE